jgi:ABC-type transport system involved in Fe-S cluster assembly fused permease/ATPase subunit
MATYVVGIAQGSIMTAGLLGGCFLAIYQVTKGTRTPGDFVILLTYWAQLKGSPQRAEGDRRTMLTIGRPITVFQQCLQTGV